MKHIHSRTGHEYEVGQLIDFDGASYDIIVITKWPDYEADELESPIIVGYYFGEYDKKDTDDYIDRYLETGNVNS